MSDHPTESDRPGSGAATEARVVAWVLGESSDFEKDALERLVERWPEMRHLKSRLEAVNNLLEEALAPREWEGGEWRLSMKLRRKLLKALEFFSGAEDTPSEVLTLPVAREVPAQDLKLEREWERRRERKRIPWRRVAVAGGVLGILGVIVFSPTLFEEDDYVASTYAISGERPRVSPTEFMAEPVVSREVEREKTDRREGIRTRLDALDATMESFGPVEAEEGWERLPSDGHDILVPIPVSGGGGGGAGTKQGASVEGADDRFVTGSFNFTDPSSDSSVRDYDRNRTQLGVQAANEEAEPGASSVAYLGSAPEQPRKSFEEAAKYAAGLNLPDSGLGGLYEQYQAAKRGISTMLASGVGRKHPQVEMANVNLKKLEEDLQDSVMVMQDVLQNQLSLVDGQLDTLKDVVEERRFDAVDKALQSQDYVEAKQDYESAMAMLQTMKITHSSKRIALKIPKNPITIHEDGTKPVKKGGTIFGGGRYESRAVVQVNPAVLEYDALAGATGPTITGGYPSRSYMAGEEALVTSESTLREVAEKLDLSKRWNTSKDEAVEELKKSVSAEQIRDTDLVGVRVRVKEKEDAALIAKELSNAYQERRRKNERERAKEALNALEAEVRAQEDLVEEKRKLFHTIVKAVGIPYIEGMAGSGIMGQSEEQIVRVAQMQQFEREKEKRQLEIQLKTLMRLENEDLMKYAAGLDLAGPIRAGGKPSGAKPIAIRERLASSGHVSTFSLHVSDVSFKLARAALQRGEWPDPKSIRTEEFVNAFDYGGSPPSLSERVGVEVAQAAHPFLQQRNLLRISVRTAALGRLEGTPLRLTVLLDHSGSMERRDRAEAVRRAFALLATQLGEQDRVTLISFSRTPRLVADRVKGTELSKLVESVATTRPGGGTNLEEALRLGLAKASEQWEEGAQNRVILLTDGAANLGNARPEDLSQVVAEMRAGQIAFDACGVGAAGLNDSVLESLTRRGDGRYYMLDGPRDADEGFVRQIAGALRPAAENVKVQVRFNPKRVRRYHLYGFENHRLAEKDFRDDAVDAAELAAEEEGTALYQFEPLPEGSGPVGTVSVRFRDTASGEMVERSWVIPYRRQVPRLANAGPEMRATACAAFLAERLRGSALGSAVRMNELEKDVSGLAEAYPLSKQVLALLEMTGKVREMEGE